MLKYIVFWISEKYYEVLECSFPQMQAQLRSFGVEIMAERIAESIPEIHSYAEKDRSLFLTDDSKALHGLLQTGAWAAAISHPGNKGQTFSEARYVVEEVPELEYSTYDEIFRRLAGLPWNILETKRCLLRETTEEDVEAFFRIYSNPEITRYTEKLYPEMEQERQYIRDYIKKIYGFYGFGVWTVVLKSTGEVIGRAGLSIRQGCEDPEIGFVIGTPWQGQGIAYEICAGILKYAREVLEFDRIQVLAEPGNEASLRLCRKLGFQEAGMVVEPERNVDCVKMLLTL